MVPVMIDSTISHPKELKEDPKTSTWFKDHTGLFKELMVEDSKISKGDWECFNRTVYHPYIQGVIDHISSKLKASNIFSAFSLFDPHHMPIASSEDCLQDYDKDNLQAFISFYGGEQ